MGEPKAFWSATSYKPVVKKKITVKGPLGGFSFIYILHLDLGEGEAKLLNSMDVWTDKCMRVCD